MRMWWASWDSGCYGNLTDISQEEEKVINTLRRKYTMMNIVSSFLWDFLLLLKYKLFFFISIFQVYEIINHSTIYLLHLSVV